MLDLAYELSPPSDPSYTSIGRRRRILFATAVRLPHSLRLHLRAIGRRRRILRAWKLKPPTAAADAAGARDGARDRNGRNGCNDAAGGAAPCAVAAGCCGYCGGGHCLGTGLSFSVRRERQFGKHWPDPLRHCPQRWCLNAWKTRYPLPWYLLWQSQARLERHVLQQAPYMRGALSGGAVCGCGSVCCGAGGGRIP